MFGNLRHIIALLIVVALGVAAYYLATNENFFTGHKDRAAKIETQTQELERDIIVPLQRLSSVKIDSSFFASPEFQALSDKSVSLQQPQLSRPNPFAPAN